MENSIKKLKPKANKLLNFVMNWQLAKPENNQELAEAISELKESHDFPKPIELFFSLPNFQRLLSTMKEGFLYKKREGTGGHDDIAHPPLEVQSLQTLVEAFHKLVFLNYNKIAIEDPIVEAKSLAGDILSHLECIQIFHNYEGKLTDEIVAYLCQETQNLASALQSTIENNASSFSDTLEVHLHEKPFQTLLSLTKGEFSKDLFRGIYPLYIELNLDAKLYHTKQQLKVIATANVHKLINQYQSLLAEMGQFYLRNTPRYVPRELKQKALDLLPLRGKEPYLGQTVNELFYELFWSERYEMIFARQEGVHRKCHTFVYTLHPIFTSLDKLLSEYPLALPKTFTSYFLRAVKPLPFANAYFGTPLFLPTLFFTGFYNTHAEYLNDMLSDHPANYPTKAMQATLELAPLLASFIETYKKAQPIASFSTIKQKLEHLFEGDEASRTFTHAEVVGKLEEGISQFIPMERPPIEQFEATFGKIAEKTRHILSLLPDALPEKALLHEKSRQLELIDIPSYAQAWLFLGEYVSALYPLIAHKSPSDAIAWLTALTLPLIE